MPCTHVGGSLSLASALDLGGWSSPLPGRFFHEKDPLRIIKTILIVNPRNVSWI